MKEKISLLFHKGLFPHNVVPPAKIPGVPMYLPTFCTIMLTIC